MFAVLESVCFCLRYLRFILCLISFYSNILWSVTLIDLLSFYILE